MESDSTRQGCRRSIMDSQLLKDIPCWTRTVSATMIHCDSHLKIARAQKKSMYNGKFRHIRRRHDIVIQVISSVVITTDYVKSKDNMTNPLTKALNKEQVYRLSR